MEYQDIQVQVENKEEVLETEKHHMNKSLIIQILPTIDNLAISLNKILLVIKV